jgi:hypothetical protein
MPSLLDIAPPEISAVELEIRGVAIKVAGIPAIDWAMLYGRFPELRKIMLGEESSDGRDRLRFLAAQSAVIAAGTGHPGDADIERASLTVLTFDERQSLFDQVVSLSLPGDVLSPLLDASPAPAANGAGRATKGSGTRSQKALSS